MASVAIIGAGPAGKAAARECIKAGWRVRVYEKEPHTGGLMRYGYPDFRMPSNVSRREHDRLAELGVEFLVGHQITTAAELQQLATEHDAVLLATGAPKPHQPDIPGITTPKVIPAVSWLHDARSAAGVAPLHGRVVVIGGGDTSVDAAVSARAFGATDVEIICRQLEQHIKAQPHEVEYAAQHQVIWRYAVEVTDIAPHADRLLLTLHQDGRTHQEQCDFLLYATGQRTDQTILEQLGVQANDDGTTNYQNVWLAGDGRYGADRLAQAILDGRKIARRILE